MCCAIATAAVACVVCELHLDWWSNLVLGVCLAIVVRYVLRYAFCYAFLQVFRRVPERLAVCSVR